METGITTSKKLSYWVTMAVLALVLASGCGDSPTDRVDAAQTRPQGSDPALPPANETTVPPPPMPDGAIVTEVEESMTWRGGDLRLDPGAIGLRGAVDPEEAYQVGAQVAGGGAAVREAEAPVRVMLGGFTDASYGRSADGSAGQMYEDLPAWLVVVPGVSVEPSGPPGVQSEAQLSDVMVVVDATTGEDLISYVEPHDSARFGEL